MTEILTVDPDVVISFWIANGDKDTRWIGSLNENDVVIVFQKNVKIGPHVYLHVLSRFGLGYVAQEI